MTILYCVTLVVFSKIKKIVSTHNMPPFTMFAPKCVDNHHTWSCNFDNILNFSKNEIVIKTLITLKGIMSFTTKKSMITSLKWLYVWL
jgi:hypothetical protein